jgi:nitrogenase molybdenum-iron protein beta chain
MAGVKVPDSITDERGRLLDMITDMHQYVSPASAWRCGAIRINWSRSDEFLICLDMKPVYIVTGTPSTRFEKRVRAVLGDSVPEAKIRGGAQADMYPDAPMDQARNRWIC